MWHSTLNISRLTTFYALSYMKCIRPTPTTVAVTANSICLGVHSPPEDSPDVLLERPRRAARALCLLLKDGVSLKSGLGSPKVVGFVSSTVLLLSAPRFLRLCGGRRRHRRLTCDKLRRLSKWWSGVSIQQRSTRYSSIIASFHTHLCSTPPFNFNSF